MDGVVHAGALTLGHLVLHRFAAKLHVEGAAVRIESSDAAALGGTIQASGSMGMANGNPQWDLTLRFTAVKPNDAGAIFQESWGSGSGDGNLHLKMSGYHTADLASSATGDFRFTWQNGGLEHLSAPNPLARVVRWTGAGTISNKTITLTSGGIAGARSGAAVPIAGTIGFDRHLDLTVQTKSGVQHITGTLDEPAVSP
jgi:hypothetical protein